MNIVRSTTLPLSPQKVAKTQNSRFSCKIALCLKKVCYKVSLCEDFQRHSCKAFIGLSIRAKMIGGGVPFNVKIRRILIYPLAKRRFSIFSLVAPQP